MLWPFCDPKAVSPLDGFLVMTSNAAATVWVLRRGGGGGGRRPPPAHHTEDDPQRERGVCSQEVSLYLVVLAQRNLMLWDLILYAVRDWRITRFICSGTTVGKYTS